MTIRDLMWILTAETSVSVSSWRNFDINLMRAAKAVIKISERCLGAEDSYLPSLGIVSVSWEWMYLILAVLKQKWSRGTISIC